MSKRTSAANSSSVEAVRRVGKVRVDARQETRRSQHIAHWTPNPSSLERERGPCGPIEHIQDAPLPPTRPRRPVPLAGPPALRQRELELVGGLDVVQFVCRVARPGGRRGLGRQAKVREDPLHWLALSDDSEHAKPGTSCVNRVLDGGRRVAQTRARECERSISSECAAVPQARAAARSAGRARGRARRGRGEHG